MCLILRADMLRDVAPVSHAEHLDGLEQHELLVGAPVLLPQRRLDVVHHAIVVRRLVREDEEARREALEAEVEVGTLGALDEAEAERQASA